MDRVWHYFRELSKIPRPSKKEERVSNWLKEVGQGLGLEVEQDEALNILIRKPASPGYEDHEGVILQGHMDMVCEKTPESDHDFDKDPIELVEEEGFLKAKDTTLGADNGIAVAMALAILEDKSLAHPALEVLVTTDEETGMSGMLDFDAHKLQGSRFINLDSEEEGVLTAGSAGGFTYSLTRSLETTAPQAGSAYHLVLDGLVGGHSGSDIDKPRGNAIILMAQALQAVYGSDLVQLASLTSGRLDNVIPSRSEAVFVSEKSQADVQAALDQVLANHGDLEGSPAFHLEETAMPEEVWASGLSEDLLHFLTTIPNGVFAHLKNSDLVQTSSNIAIIDQKDGEVEVVISFRSSEEVDLGKLRAKVDEAADQARLASRTFAVYPAWGFMEESALRDTCCRTYKEVTGKDMEVLVIHAGLECGCIYDQRPELEFVSIGPNMYDVHSVKERLDMASAERTFAYVKEILKAL
ncbi:MAG: beta-Ala-His dipeptidase [Firmicutes bacterium]|nr:beta-Ala-His dipeptidase [Bacillota bacterium]